MLPFFLEEAVVFLDMVASFSSSFPEPDGSKVVCRFRKSPFGSASLLVRVLLAEAGSFSMGEGSSVIAVGEFGFACLERTLSPESKRKGLGVDEEGVSVKVPPSFSISRELAEGVRL